MCVALPRDHAGRPVGGKTSAPRGRWQRAFPDDWTRRHDRAEESIGSTARGAGRCLSPGWAIRKPAARRGIPCTPNASATGRRDDGWAHARQCRPAPGGAALRRAPSRRRRWRGTRHEDRAARKSVPAPRSARCGRARAPLRMPLESPACPAGLGGGIGHFGRERPDQDAGFGGPAIVSGRPVGRPAPPGAAVLAGPIAPRPRRDPRAPPARSPPPAPRCRRHRAAGRSDRAARRRAPARRSARPAPARRCGRTG